MHQSRLKYSPVIKDQTTVYKNSNLVVATRKKRCFSVWKTLGVKYIFILVRLYNPIIVSLLLLGPPF